MSLIFIFTRWLAPRLIGRTCKAPDERLDTYQQRLNERDRRDWKELKEAEHEVQERFIDEIRRLKLTPQHADMEAVVKMLNDWEERISAPKREPIFALKEESRLEMDRIWLALMPVCFTLLKYGVFYAKRLPHASRLIGLSFSWPSQCFKPVLGPEAGTDPRTLQIRVPLDRLVCDPEVLSSQRNVSQQGLPGNEYRITSNMCMLTRL